METVLKVPYLVNIRGQSDFFDGLSSEWTFGLGLGSGVCPGAMTAVNGVFSYEDRISGHVHLAQEWFRGYVVVSAVLPPRICGDFYPLIDAIFGPQFFLHRQDRLFLPRPVLTFTG